MSGPVAMLLSRVKQDLTGDPALLETKFEARQLLPWRTRGVATLKDTDGAKPKLARGGMREPRGMSLDEANVWFAQRMLQRQPGDKWSSRIHCPSRRLTGATPITCFNSAAEGSTSNTT